MPSIAIIGTRGYPSYYGGFETAVRKLAPYLVGQGWDVTVYSRPGATRPDDPHRDHRVHVIETRGFEKKSLSTLTYGYSAAKHCIKQRPDVALVMNVANGYWLPLLKRAGIPTLVNVDGIEWDRAKWGRVAKWVFHTGARWTARHGTRMVYDSREIARRWKDEFGLEGDFIPYGGDPVDGDLPVEPGLERRRYALVVARFVPENSIPEFFDAAPEIAKESDVVVVGSGGYGGELDRRAQELTQFSPRIRWLGHVSDDQRLLSLWKHAGAYFHGHSVGGTNPALVQAMAAGAPIVARDTVYNREVLGPTGRFTSPQPVEIARSVRELLRSTEAQEAAARDNAARALNDYSWAAVCGRYESSLRARIGALA
ncbi:glycosyltransferase [Microbacterium jejuense]|uniref:glycosyltransferase n=1 Tax=Microbacterium jejuense TaxID=1263637 RepID=UPI001CB7D65F|nr:glycosyltransferase [Microbacterium jejuense]